MSESAWDYFDNVCNTSPIHLKDFSFTNNSLSESFKSWIANNEAVLKFDNNLNKWVKEHLMSQLEIADRNITPENQQIILQNIHAYLDSYIQPLVQQHQAYFIVRDESFLFEKVSVQAQKYIDSHCKELASDLYWNIEHQFRPAGLLEIKNKILFLISPFNLEILLNQYSPSISLRKVESDIHEFTFNKPTCYFDTRNHSKQIVTFLNTHSSLFYFTNFTLYDEYFHLDSSYRVIGLKYSEICKSVSADFLDKMGNDSHKNAIILNKFIVDNGFTSDYLDSIIFNNGAKEEFTQIRDSVICDFEKWCKKLVELSELSNKELNELIEITFRKMLIIDALTKGLGKYINEAMSLKLSYEKPIMEL